MRAAMLGLSGLALTEAEAALLRDLPPCGAVLFKRNIATPDQLAGLIGQLRAILPESAAIGLDQEGGRVARLRPPHWRAHPAAARIGALAERDRARGRRAAYLHGAAIGVEARAAGFDLVFAPVLDLRLPGASDVIGDRALGADPALVAELGQAIADGLLAAGVIPVGKHAPGHGHALVDSHDTLPVVSRQAPIDADMAVFRSCRALPAMMTAHIRYEALDPDAPATLSAQVIGQYIRREIGFGGLLVSDDLSMGALSGAPAERARRCLDAGCDVALLCQGDGDANQAVLRAVPELAGASLARWHCARSTARQAALERKALDLEALTAEREALLAC